MILQKTCGRVDNELFFSQKLLIDMSQKNEQLKFHPLGFDFEKVISLFIKELNFESHLVR